MEKQLTIPQEWKQWTPSQPKSDPGQGLLRQQQEKIRAKTVDRQIKKPSLFVRDLQRLISYISKEIQEPFSVVIREQLADLSNKVMTAVREAKGFVLSKDVQNNLLQLIGKLNEPKESFLRLDRLFDEAYVVRASLAGMLRRVAAIFLSEDARQR